MGVDTPKGDGSMTHDDSYLEQRLTLRVCIWVMIRVVQHMSLCMMTRIPHLILGAVLVSQYVNMVEMFDHMSQIIWKCS